MLLSSEWCWVCWFKPFHVRVKCLHLFQNSLHGFHSTFTCRSSFLLVKLVWTFWWFSWILHYRCVVCVLVGNFLHWRDVAQHKVVDLLKFNGLSPHFTSTDSAWLNHLRVLTFRPGWVEKWTARWKHSIAKNRYCVKTAVSRSALLKGKAAEVFICRVNHNLEAWMKGRGHFALYRNIYHLFFREGSYLKKKKGRERERKRQTHTYTVQRNDTYEILITVIVLKYKGRWAS